MKKNLQKCTAMLLALVLALSLTACAPVAPEQDDTPLVPVADGATIGEGSKTFQMEVTDADGKVVKFTVKSDALKGIFFNYIVLVGRLFGRICIRSGILIRFF